MLADELRVESDDARQSLGIPSGRDFPSRTHVVPSSSPMASMKETKFAPDCNPASTGFVAASGPADADATILDEALEQMPALLQHAVPDGTWLPKRVYLRLSGISGSGLES